MNITTAKKFRRKFVASKTRYKMLDVVTYIIGLYDPYGVDHSERVAEWAIAIGRHIKLSNAVLEELELSALLHDVGKLGVPESIRAKSGALTSAEYFLMKQHPIIGNEIISRMNGNISLTVRRNVYHHHENWNGSGYPDGLAGEKIPLGARIIRVADTFDALTHSRGYRFPNEKNIALELMIREQEEKQIYDPKILQAFMEVSIAKGIHKKHVYQDG
jgi:HD-GYP domain-containing protein (c-di-GMP phosphodiesterase class II)